MQPVLTGIVEPLLQACRLSADGLDPSDAAVFMLNNVDVIREALAAHAVRIYVSALARVGACVCRASCLVKDRVRENRGDPLRPERPGGGGVGEFRAARVRWSGAFLMCAVF